MFDGEDIVDLNGSGRPGTVTAPPFEATLKMLGLPATIGLTLEQAASTEGSISPSKTMSQTALA